jgi:hypothetical protein
MAGTKKATREKETHERSASCSLEPAPTATWYAGYSGAAHPILFFALFMLLCGRKKAQKASMDVSKERVDGVYMRLSWLPCLPKLTY